MDRVDQEKVQLLIYYVGYWSQNLENTLLTEINIKNYLTKYLKTYLTASANFSFDETIVKNIAFGENDDKIDLKK